MQFRPATDNDVANYVTFATAAQEWLRGRGLGQYVPAAHAASAASIAARVAAGSLVVVELAGEAAGFFSLERAASPWWPRDGVPALYLAGMVVGPGFRGRGIGGAILNWCMGQAAERGCQAVRLDCHAGNPWLCQYYEAHGFGLCGRIEQHPGYDGCLYEARVANPGRCPGLGNPIPSG